MSKKEVVDQVIIRLIRSEAVEDQVALQKMLQEKDIVILSDYKKGVIYNEFHSSLVRSVLY